MGTGALADGHGCFGRWAKVLWPMMGRGVQADVRSALTYVLLYLLTVGCAQLHAKCMTRDVQLIGWCAYS